jgi:hypothetical protein
VSSPTEIPEGRIFISACYREQCHRTKWTGMVSTSISESTSALLHCLSNDSRVVIRQGLKVCWSCFREDSLAS